MSKILLVDDEFAILEILSAIIESIGEHTIETAQNGKQAYEKLLEQEFDLMVTDMQMPEMGGRKLIETIKEEGLALGMPIIIYSGYVGEKDVADLLKAGATYYLGKPVEVPVFVEYVEKCLAMTSE